MDVNFVGKVIDEKQEKNEKYIVFSFYELRVKYNLTEDEISKFLELSKNRLENTNYKVYFTGEEYTYQGITKKVQDNELMVAILQ